MTTVNVLVDDITVEVATSGPPGPPGSGANGGLITTSGATVTPGFNYGVCTSRGAMNVTVPPIASWPDGGIMDFEDVDYDAATNHFTINPNGADVMKFEGGTVSNVVMQTNGVTIRIRKVRAADNSVFLKAGFYGSA